MSEVGRKGMTAWKNHFVVLTIALLSVSFPIFLMTGYTALYWAWLRGNLQAALPYLPWARNSGMVAMAGAVVALGVLFSSSTFPIRPKARLALSLLATATIGFFSEFRNEGKFHLKRLVHFFGPGTWIHDGLNHLVSSLGDRFIKSSTRTGTISSWDRRSSAFSSPSSFSKSTERTAIKARSA